MWYSRNTNISGNIIKHNLRTSMNERTHFFIKIYLTLFILERVDVSGVGERWVERHIYSGRGLLLPISSTGSQGVPTLAPPCKQRRLWSPACPTLDSRRYLHSVFNLTAWFSLCGLLPVTHLCGPDCPVY